MTEPEFLWSQSLCKAQVDPHLFDDLQGVENTDARERLERLRDLCEVRIEDKAQLKELRDAVKALKKERKLSGEERDLFDEVTEELREIKEDLKLASTPQGQFTLAANDWIQKLYQPLRSDKRFEDVYMMRSGEEARLIAHGSVASQRDLKDLEELVLQHRSPWPLEFQIQVSPD